MNPNEPCICPSGFTCIADEHDVCVCSPHADDHRPGCPMLTPQDGER